MSKRKKFTVPAASLAVAEVTEVPGLARYQSISDGVHIDFSKGTLSATNGEMAYVSYVPEIAEPESEQEAFLRASDIAAAHSVLEREPSRDVEIAVHKNTASVDVGEITVKADILKNPDLSIPGVISEDAPSYVTYLDAKTIIALADHLQANGVTNTDKGETKFDGTLVEVRGYETDDPMEFWFVDAAGNDACVAIAGVQVDNPGWLGRTSGITPRRTLQMSINTDHRTRNRAFKNRAKQG